ncbi:MAG: ATP synthase F1 subunit epsilon [Pirellulales bacterium]
MEQHEQSAGATTGVPKVAGASDRILDCVIVTPEATVLEHPAQFVVVPLYDGELGIAPGHTPLIGRLGYGEMRLVEGGKTHRLYIDGGFVQVSDNVVSVLTPRAVPAEKLDTAVIDEQLHAAQARPANSPEALDARQRSIAQSRAQLRVARHAGGRPASSAGH